MTTTPPASPLLQRALAAASDTRFLEIAPGALAAVPRIFREAFGPRHAILVADPNTYRVAGRTVESALRSAGIPLRPAAILDDPHLYAEWTFVEQVDAALAGHDAIPIAVGSGTINDLVKLSAHRAGRQYLCVATAASMDGYTAFGSSITAKGSKQTFDCPAPRAVVADLDVIAAAPREMTASGFADLIAKIPAGADWLVADVLGVEKLDPVAWDFVQTNLRAWCAEPGRGLIEGLLMTGFAMQAMKSSRPASGAEHQFSHLWDMQHHTHNGSPPSHGFKVGIGTLAVTCLYEFLLTQDLAQIDFDRALAAWPADADEAERAARAHFDIPELADKAALETRTKYLPRPALRAELQRLQSEWPALRKRLRDQLIPSAELVRLFEKAGAPTAPEQIGISRPRLRDSFRQAYFIRRRYTALDLAARAGLLDPALDHLFGPGGPWPLQT